MKNNYFEITKDSIEKVNYIIENMDGSSFHNHYHILYDICNSLKDVTYVEIGSFAGGSASLMSTNKNVKKIISIDLGRPIDKSIPIKNVNKFKHKECEYTYIEGDSKDKNTIEKLEMLVDSVDILFIDGDHTYNGVRSDFNNYSKFVKSGGYIVFDDYLDFNHSPDVKKFVDDLVKDIPKNQYEVIGSLKYEELKLTNRMKESSNEFILKKL
jgi:cephalosporin hydroxylase